MTTTKRRYFYQSPYTKEVIHVTIQNDCNTWGASIHNTMECLRQWELTVGYKTFHFPSKQKAIAYVETLDLVHERLIFLVMQYQPRMRLLTETI